MGEPLVRNELSRAEKGCRRRGKGCARVGERRVEAASGRAGGWTIPNWNRCWREMGNGCDDGKEREGHCAGKY